MKLCPYLKDIHNFPLITVKFPANFLGNFCKLHLKSLSLKLAGLLIISFVYLSPFLFVPDPCVPQNLVASVNCNMKVVSLSWNASNRTKFYTVSADAANKTTVIYTNVTTTNVSDLTCGQNYSLRVTPHSQHCPGSYCAMTYVQTCRLNI